MLELVPDRVLLKVLQIIVKFRPEPTCRENVLKLSVRIKSMELSSIKPIAQVQVKALAVASDVATTITSTQQRFGHERQNSRIRLSVTWIRLTPI